MRDNITVAIINTGRTATTEPIYQYDGGQILIIRGVELPPAYQVHFSNERSGNSQTMIGSGEGVEIPKELIAEGRTIYAWLYIQTGPTDGETVCRITIPVAQRARIAEDTPTPEQQSAIDQAIAALNSAVEEVQGIAEGMEQQIDDALTEAKESGEFDGEPGAPGVGVPAGGSQGQVLAKRSGTNFDTEWVNQQGGSGGVYLAPGENTRIRCEHDNFMPFFGNVNRKLCSYITSPCNCDLQAGTSLAVIK